MNPEYTKPIRQRPVVDCSGDPGRTKQSFKDDCDMRKIVGKYRRTGVLPVSLRQPVFGDFADTEDYRTQVENMLHVQDVFDALPSDLRSELKNDPSQLIDWMADEDNRDRAIEVGLLPKPTKTPPEEPDAPEEPSVAPEEAPAQ